MKYKKIMLFFSVALPLCVILRFIQLEFIIETATGFFKQEFEVFGGYITAVIFAFCAMAAIFSFTSHRSPEHPPKPNIAISLSSLLFAVSIIFEALTESSAQVVSTWQMSLLRISGILAAVYLIIFALKRFVDIPLPAIASAVLPLYLIFKIIFNFSAISALALISDNILLIAAYCVSLLFAISFVKLYNNSDTERNFRKLLATGLSSVILCLTQSVPHIIVNVSNGYNYLHTSMAANINLLFLGLFIAAFIFSHFSKENACE